MVRSYESTIKQHFEETYGPAKSHQEARDVAAGALAKLLKNRNSFWWSMIPLVSATFCKWCPVVVTFVTCKCLTSVLSGERGRPRLIYLGHSALPYMAFHQQDDGEILAGVDGIANLQFFRHPKKNNVQKLPWHRPCQTRVGGLLLITILLWKRAGLRDKLLDLPVGR